MDGTQERLQRDASDHESLGQSPASEEPEPSPVSSQDQHELLLPEGENLIGLTSHIINQTFQALYPVSTETFAEAAHKGSLIEKDDILSDDTTDASSYVPIFKTMYDSDCKVRREQIHQRFQNRKLEAGRLLELIKDRMKTAMSKDRETEEYAEKIGLGDSAQILIGPFGYQLESKELEDFPSSLTACLTNAKGYIHNYQVKKAKRAGNSGTDSSNGTASRPGSIAFKSIRKIKAKKFDCSDPARDVSNRSKISVNQNHTVPIITSSPTRIKPNEFTRREGNCTREMIKATSSLKNDPLFSATPNPIRFTEYNVTGSYHSIVTIRNKSRLGRRLRILGPQTRYFSIDKIKYPRPHGGVVAPGLYVELCVCFHPDSRGEYLDSLGVQYESEPGGSTVSFQVPLIASRPPPKLSISARFNASPSLVGSSSVTRYTCLNSGGTASFRLFTLKRWRELELEKVTPHSFLSFSQSSNESFRCRYTALLAEKETDNTVCAEHFKVSPSHFCLSVGQQVELTIEFSPLRAGIDQAQFIILCDNCVAQAITIEGTGSFVSVQFGRIDDGGTMSESEQFTDIQSIYFPPTLIGFVPSSSPAKKLFNVVNKTPIDLLFSWEIIAVNGLEIEDGQKCFQIHPSEGVLGNDTTSFRSTFTPVKPGTFRGKAVLRLHQIPPQSINADVYDKSPLIDVRSLELSLTGVGRSGEFVIEPQVLSISMLKRGNAPAYKVSLRNDQSAHVDFAWRPKLTIRRRGRRDRKLDDQYTEIYSKQTSNPIDIVFDPPSGRIEAHSTISVSVLLTPTWSGPFSMAVSCIIPSLTSKPAFERWLLLEGCVEQPQVSFLFPHIDFGVIASTSIKQTILTLRNDSKLVKASWTLTHSDPVTSAATSTKSIESKLHDESLKDTANTMRAFLRYHPNQGVLHPGMTTDIAVECHGGAQPELFEALVSCQLEPETLFTGQIVQNFAKIRARARIESPNVYVTPQTLLLGTTYVGDSVKKTLLLTNLSSLRCEFRWSQPYGPSLQYKVEFDPAIGILEPHGTASTELHYTPLQDGEVSLLVACSIKGMGSPLGVECKTIQKGLQLRYEVIESSAIKYEDVEVQLGESKTEMLVDSTGPNACISLPVLSFGDHVPLGEPRALTLLVQNHSGVATCLNIYPKRYKIATIDVPNDTENGASRTANDHLQTSQKRMNQLLALDQGLAIEIIPETAPILAWQQAVFTITCFNNMPGTFADAIVISPVNHDSVELPMHATIVGSPLSWSHPGNPKNQVPTLAFGQVAVSSPVQERIASFINRTPHTINVRWRIAPVGLENMIVRVSIRVHSTGEARVKISHKDDTEPDSPFVLRKIDHQNRSLKSDSVDHLTRTLVPPFTKMNLTIAFTPPAVPASVKMYLIGDADWRHEGDWTAQSPAKPVGTALQAVRIANKPKCVWPEASTETEWDGEHQPSSLKLLLDAQVIKPQLIVDQLEIGKKLPKTMKDSVLFETYWPLLPSKSSVKDMHPWHRKMIHLMNPCEIPLTFRLGCTGPFKLIKTPHRPNRNPMLGNELLPQRFMKMELCMVLTSEAAAFQLEPTSSKVVAHGQLHIEFHQGTTQTLPLVVEIQRPILLVTPTVHNFGHVQLSHRRSLTLSLVNPKPISLNFEIQHLPLHPELITPMQSMRNGDLNAFHIERTSGVVEGPTMSLASVGSYLPGSKSPAVESTLKPIVQLKIHFEPLKCSHYYSCFRFQVAYGNEIDIFLEGYGTLSEKPA